MDICVRLCVCVCVCFCLRSVLVSFALYAGADTLARVRGILHRHVGHTACMCRLEDRMSRHTEREREDRHAILNACKMYTREHARLGDLKRAIDHGAGRALEGPCSLE